MRRMRRPETAGRVGMKGEGGCRRRSRRQKQPLPSHDQLSTRFAGEIRTSTRQEYSVVVTGML